MTRFHYRAVDAAGHVTEAALDAENQTSAAQQLIRAGLVPIRIDDDRPMAWRGFLLSRSRMTRVTPAQLALFTRQLAMLSGAGLPLDQALQAVASHVQDKGTLAPLVAKLRGGASLGDALAGTGAFPPFYLGLVEAAEASGQLSSVLGHLADHLEYTARLTASLKSALVYPALVLLTGLGSLGVFVGFLLPQFQSILGDAHIAMPLTARFLLAFSTLLANYWGLILPLGLSLAILAQRQMRQPANRYRRDRLLLALPIVGNLLRRRICAQFARTLGLMIDNGIAMVPALDIAAKTISNNVILTAIESVIRQSREGGGLGEPLRRSGVFPELATQLIKVGEDSAQLGPMLTKVAEIQDWELRQSLDRLLALLAPAMTILLGFMVAGVIGSVLAAMSRVYDVAN